MVIATISSKTRLASVSFFKYCVIVQIGISKFLQEDIGIISLSFRFRNEPSYSNMLPACFFHSAATIIE